MNIAATLRQHDIVEEPPIILCECSRTQETRSEVRPTPLPHPSRLKPSRTQFPLVSVLSPTTMDRHWSHANLYHCFQQQTWPNKELVVLDTGERPSPFFLSLMDPRVRYTHLELPSNVADLITTMRKFTAVADSPPGGGYPTDAWRDAWKLARLALDDASNGREWYELEDEGVESMLFSDIVRHVISLGSKRNWLSSQAKGTILCNFDDDDVYSPHYIERLASNLLHHDASLLKLSAFLHLDMRRHTLYYCDPDEPYGPQREQSYFEFMANKQANMHGMRWGYGFSVMHTAGLARACPYEHVNFGEDYKMVLDAASRSYLRCICFNDVQNDAIALHVSHHGGNSSCVTYGRQIGGAGAGMISPYDNGRAQMERLMASVDECFSQSIGAAPISAILRRLDEDLKASMHAKAEEQAALAEVERMNGVSGQEHPSDFVWEEGDEVELMALKSRQATASRLAMNHLSALGQDRVESSVARVLAAGAAKRLLDNTDSSYDGNALSGEY